MPFRDHFPRIPLELPTVDGVTEIEFVLDTGFEGDITLPPAVVRRLDARHRGSQYRLLADGSEVECAIYHVYLEWNGVSRKTEVLVLETNPLIGLLLLDGSHIDIEATEGGEVVIEPLN